MIRWTRLADVLAPTAPPERLATFRVLVTGFITAYLLVRLPVFLALGDNHPSRFEPVGVISLLNQPLPSTAVKLVAAATVVLGGAAFVGFRFSLSGPLFAVLVLAVFSYRSSWGQILWFEHLMALHGAVVGFSPAADALSLDARRSSPRAVAHVRYGWPVRLAAIITVTTYLIAGVAKVRIGGLDWVEGESLRNHIAFSAARTEVLGGFSSPLAKPLMNLPWVLTVPAAGSVLLELAAPLALAGGPLRRVWVVATWSMHALIAASMFVVFAYPLYGIAFAPLYRLEHLGPRIVATTRSLRRPARSSR